MILMMTLGLEIFLRAGSMTIWGGTARPMPIGISDAPLFLGPLLINRAYAVGAAIAIAMFGLFVLFFRTRMGVVLRAISDDYTAAWSVGISVERGVALSWAMSAVVATIAGVLWSSVQGVDQSLAQLLLKGVTVAVLGGTGQHRRRAARRRAAGYRRRRCLQRPRSDAGRRQPRSGGRGDADPDHPGPTARTLRPPRYRESVSACFSARPGSFIPTTPPTGRCFRFRPTAWMIGILLLLAFAAPLYMNSLYLSSYMLPWLVWTAGALGLNLILGWAGQFHLGYAAVMGIGAYAAVHAMRAGIPWEIAIILAGLTAAAIGTRVCLRRTSRQGPVSGA